MAEYTRFINDEQWKLMEPLRCKMAESFEDIVRQYDSWIKRRLRCYLWKQWGRAGYRRLCALGVSRDLAWNTCKSAHGPRRRSRSPALAFALPAHYFADLGLPSLLGYQLNQLNRRGT